MMIPRPSTSIFATAFLSVFALASCLAQTTSAPALPARPPAGPGGPQEGPSSKLRSTGLEASGGSIAEGVYSNSIFGFSLQIPPGWAVVPATDPPIKPGAEQPPLAKPHQSNRTLLIVTENAPLRKSYQRRSIQVTATRLAVQPGPTTAEGFLAHSQKTAKERGMPVEYLGDPEEVTIKGHKLWKVALNENTNGVVQHAEQYVTVEKDMLLQFFLVSPDDAGLKDLQPSIQSLQFNDTGKKKVSSESAKSVPPGGKRPPAAPRN